MSDQLIGLVGIVMLLLLMLSRMPVGFVMALTGLLGICLLRGPEAALGVLKTVPYSTVASYTFSILPLFVLMGELAFRSGLTETLYNAVYKLIGHLRGGLAMATIAACGIFSAISGSSPATAGAMGKVALPQMRKYHYDPNLAAASVVAGGSLGNIIPPGVGIVIYGVLTEQSIGRLILACLIPGFVLMVLYMIAAFLLAARYPKLAPSGPRYSLPEKLVAVKGMVPIAVIFIITIGGIYLGVFSATEAAAVGTFLTLVYALGRGLNLRGLVECLMESAKFSGMAITILIGAMIFGYFMSVAAVPQAVAEFISGLGVSRYVVLAGIMASYLILGCFMESLAMLLLTVPIFFPVIIKLGFDPIWFGVMVVTAMEEGMITPPVGMNLYIVKGVAEDLKLEGLFRAVIPFVTSIIVFQVLLVVCPELALWIPQRMKY